MEASSSGEPPGDNLQPAITITIEDNEQNSTSQAQSPNPPEPRSPSSKRRRRSRIPPSSVTAFIESKGYFSVTELVGPTWCEYSYQYGILGLSFLPVAERPKEILLPSGNVIKPNETLAVRKEQIQVQGREIHKKLEEEIHPVQVYVETKTREDDWALRLLRLVVGLRSLIGAGCVRELPIFGWIEGHLVMGIIDEIERRDFPKFRQSPPVRQWQPGDVQPDQTKLSFGDPPTTPTKARPAQGKKSPKAVKNISAPNGTRFASQEEWKAHQRKVDAQKKLDAKDKAKASKAKASPSKKKQNSSQPSTPSKQGTLTGFFASKADHKQSQTDPTTPTKASAEAVGGQNALSSPPFAKEESTSQATPSQKARSKQIDDGSSSGSRARWGYFLSDTKTRLFPTVPPVADQRAARLQTMLYKRLLDGLCLGAVERQQARTAATASTSQDRQDPSQPKSDAGAAKEPSSTDLQTFYYATSGLRLDANATPLDFGVLFASLELDFDRELSKAFLDDARMLIGDSPLDGAVNLVATAAPSTGSTRSTLANVVDLVDQTVLELIGKAHDGAKVALDPKQPLPAVGVQSELSLVYRLQAQRGRWKRKASKGKARFDSDEQPAQSKPGATSSRPIEVPSDDEAALQLAIALSLETQVQDVGAESTANQASTVQISSQVDHLTSTAAKPEASSSKVKDDGPKKPSKRRTRQEGSPQQSRRRKSQRLASRGDYSQSSDPIQLIDLTEELPVLSEFVQRETQPAQGTDAVPSTSTLPSTPRNSFPPSPSRSSSSRLIGRVNYPHLSTTLSNHLKSVLSFWDGSRPPLGVKEEETWKCNGCEYREGCEWRNAKGEEKWKWSLERWSGRKEEGENESVMTGAEESNDEQGKDLSIVEIGEVSEDQDQESGGTSGIEGMDDDDEEALWQQFDDPDGMDLDFLC